MIIWPCCFQPVNSYLFWWRARVRMGHVLHEGGKQGVRKKKDQILHSSLKGIYSATCLYCIVNETVMILVCVSLFMIVSCHLYFSFLLYVKQLFKSLHVIYICPIFTVNKILFSYISFSLNIFVRAKKWVSINYNWIHCEVLCDKERLRW